MEKKKDYVKKDFVEWGKMGGRPTLNSEKKTERLYLTFTKKEIDFIINQSVQKNFSKVNDYARFILLDKKLPNFEQDKILISYANNFQKISNYMQMGIFNESEKKRLLDEISNTINLIKNKIEWL